MFNASSLLDAVVAGMASPRATAQPDSRQQNFLRDAIEAFAIGRGGTMGKVFRQATGGLRDMADDATGGLDRQVDKTVRTVTGGSFEELKRQAREVIGRNPELAEGALLGIAGLLLGTRRGRGIAANLAGLGGLALISGLVYRAFQNYQAGRPLLELEDKPQNEDALLFIRAMVAATAADRHLDDAERSRVMTGMSRVGVQADAIQWLEREFASPATVDELVSLASTPEKAAQLYAAARLAVDPDTAQEREFLSRLSAGLRLDATVKTEIDEGVSEIKVAAAKSPAA